MPSSSLDGIREPYVGLRTFTENDARIFFGREDQVNELVERLKAHRFVSVIGSSGSGKSSLVRAGLVPLLKSEKVAAPYTKWVVATMSPGSDPLGALARALSEKLEEPNIVELTQTLNRSSAGITRAVQSLLKPDHNLLLVVDQFEELFRFALEGQEARSSASAFIKLLLAATGNAELPIVDADRAPISVIVTMRAGYLGNCSEFRGLPEVMTKCQLLVPQLTRWQIRRAIEGPIGLTTRRIDPELVQKVLNDLPERQDDLPVLQYTLARMWDEIGEGDQLKLDQYDSVGGLSGALNRGAERALPNDLHKRGVVRRLFQLIVEPGGPDGATRRPAHLSELVAVCSISRPELLAIIEELRAPGFLTLSEDPDPVVDISHESLIRQWATLRGWIDEERLSAKIYTRLADNALDGRLLTAGNLMEALKWREAEKPNAAWAKRYPPLEDGVFDKALKHLSRSDSEAQKQRVFRRLITIAVSTAVIGSLATVTAVTTTSNMQLQSQRDQIASNNRQIISSSAAKVAAQKLAFDAKEKTAKAILEAAALKAAKSRLAAEVTAQNAMIAAKSATLARTKSGLLKTSRVAALGLGGLAKAYAGNGGFDVVKGLDFALKAISIGREAHLGQEEHRQVLEDLRFAVLASPGSFLSDHAEKVMTRLANSSEIDAAVDVGPGGSVVFWRNHAGEVRLWSEQRKASITLHNLPDPGGFNHFGFEAFLNNDIVIYRLSTDMPGEDSIEFWSVGGTPRRLLSTRVARESHIFSSTRPGYFILSKSDKSGYCYGRVSISSGLVQWGAQMNGEFAGEDPTGSLAYGKDSTAPTYDIRTDPLNPKELGFSVSPPYSHYPTWLSFSPDGAFYLKGFYLTGEKRGQLQSEVSTWQVRNTASTSLLNTMPRNWDQYISGWTIDNRLIGVVSKDTSMRRYLGVFSRDLKLISTSSLGPASHFRMAPGGRYFLGTNGRYKGRLYVLDVLHPNSGWIDTGITGAFDGSIFPALKTVNCTIFFSDNGALKKWSVEDAAHDFAKASEVELIRRANEILAPFRKTGSLAEGN